MKFLVTGKNGQLGFELQRALAPLGAIIAVDREDCDLADADAIRRLVRSVQPDLIINPAAYTAVDRAESEPQLAVVDPSLRVRGVERLRVIDASVMPTVTSANTNAPSLMIGEKGAAHVLGQV